MKTKTSTSKKTTIVKKAKKRNKAVANESTPSVVTKLPALSEKQISSLSSANIAKMISNFMTFRSLVKDVSQGIGRLEGFMDSTYNMFSVAQQMLGSTNRKKNPFSFLLPKAKKKDIDDEEIPIIKFPGENKRSKSKSGPPPMLGNLMENIDINQILKIAQSPMFQKMLSGLLTGKAASASSSVQDNE